MVVDCWGPWQAERQRPQGRHHKIGPLPPDFVGDPQRKDAPEQQSEAEVALVLGRHLAGGLMGVSEKKIADDATG